MALTKRTCGLLLFSVLMFCIAAPAAARSLPSLSAQDMSDVDETNNVTVGATPYFPRNTVKRAFGVNLLQRGILPVHVIIENRGQTEIRLQTEALRLEDGAGNTWELLPADQAVLRSRANPVLRGLGNLGVAGGFYGLFTQSIRRGATFGGVLGVSGAVGTIVGNKRRDRHIQRMTYAGDLIPPSTTVGGVLFFTRTKTAGRGQNINSIGNVRLAYILEGTGKGPVMGDLALTDPVGSGFTKRLSKDCRERGFSVGTHTGLGGFLKDANIGLTGPLVRLGLETAYDVSRHVAPFADFSIILGYSDRDLSQTVRNIYQTFYVFDAGAYYTFLQGPVTPYIKGGVGVYKQSQEDDFPTPGVVVPDVGANFHGQGAAGVDLSVARRHRFQLEGRWDYFKTGVADLQAVHFDVGYRFVF